MPAQGRAVFSGANPEKNMPRKGPVPKREILPDPIYGSRLVARFVNRLMYNGKKGAAEKIFYNALAALGEKTGEEALPAFEKAIENIKPHLEVKSRRVGGATYQVPMEVRPERQISLAIRWLITYARARGEKGMVSKLSGELIDAWNNRGGAIKKKEDTHRMAEANKAFAHYRW
jgi:small subunit ribosomal protein S7